MNKVFQKKYAVIALLAGLFISFSAGAQVASKTNNTEAKKDGAKGYSGVYKGYQLVPNTMAIFCEMSGEDFFDYNKFSDCMDKIVLKVTNENASVSEQGKEMLAEMRYEWLKYMAGNSIAKMAAQNDSDNVKDKMDDAAGNAKTEHEDITLSASSNNYLAKTINNLQSLIAADSIYSGIEGIREVNKSVLNLEKIKEDNEKSAQEVKSEVSGTVIGASASLKNQGTTYLANGMCQVDGEEKTCPDGTYTSGDGVTVECEGGACGPVIVGNKPSENSETSSSGSSGTSNNEQNSKKSDVKIGNLIKAFTK